MTTADPVALRSPFLVLRRPARTVPDDGSSSIIVVPSPTREQDASGRNSWLQALLPIVGAFGFIGFVVISPSPVFIAVGALFAVGMVASSVGVTVDQRRREHKKLTRTRSRYFAALADVRAEIREAVDKQWEVGRRCDPPPELLLSLTRSPNRLWERRPQDADFLAVRFGRGPAALRASVKAPPEGTGGAFDQVCQYELDRLLSSGSRVDGAPLRIDLRSSRWSLFAGDPDGSRAALRSVLAQVALWHGPDDVRLLIATDERHAAQWAWARWLPHLRWSESDLPNGSLLLTDPEVLQRALIHLAGSRQSAASPAGRSSLRPGDPPAYAGPHVLVVLDGLPMDEEMEALQLLRTLPGLGITVLEVATEQLKWEPPWVDQVLEVDAGGALIRGPVDAVGALDIDSLVHVDATSVTVCEALARRLAPWRLPGHSLTDAVRSPDVTELLGVPDVGALHPDTVWAAGGAAGGQGDLRIPIGSSPDGLPVVLDLKESARGGMGPHGLLVGATGSGKSELLRTLVIGLALTYPPELVSLVLVDFKGGATFAGLADLPQVSGVITNLFDQLHLVDRMRDALEGEIARRQQLLSDVGNLPSAHEYRRLRGRDRPDLPTLPDLVVIVDEFSELIVARPDFVDTFVAIGRVGRSLGVHLLLASQRVDEGKLRGLDSHISYRIALRTFSASDSVSAIGSPAAYHLPPVAGSGILKVGSTLFQRFRAAHVSAPYDDPRGVRRAGLITRFDPMAGPLALVERSELPAQDDGAKPVPTIASVVVERLQDDTRRSHRIWLPPLAERVPLGTVLQNVLDHPQRGAVAADWPGVGRLRAPFALLDRPRHQQMTPHAPDLSGPAGSMLVVGAPQTGKSTLLKSLVLSLALTHTPTEVQVYCVDLGGGSLEELEQLPHVGAVARRGDSERIARTVEQVAGTLTQREQLFSARGIASMADYRDRRAAGQLTDQPLGDIFLVVDGIGDLRRDHEQLEAAVVELATRGAGLGIHVVVTATRSMDLRPALRDNLAGRIELRLNDPMDSMIDRRRAATVPEGIAGRGLAADGSMLQVLLPALADVPGNLAATLARVERAWPGPAAPPVKVLPTDLDVGALPAVGTEEPPGVPIGVQERDLSPYYLDLSGNDPHLAVLGDTESGKTTVLATYLNGLAARSKPDQATVYLIDYRLTLLDTVAPEFLAGYASASTAAQQLVAEIEQLLTERAPSSALSRAELRRRSWWSGPEIYLVVDDYDLVVSGFDNLLAPLSDFIPQGYDIGFHLIVARRTAGAARALGDAVLGRLKEFGNPGLLLSGDRAEGPLMAGQRPAVRPPGRGLLVRRRSEPDLLQIARRTAQDDEHDNGRH